MIRTSAAVLVLLVLTGCQQGTPGQSDAAVPVLDGTASDAMLPLDTVTSEPPLDPRVTRSGKTAAGDDAAAEATDAAAEDPAAPAPAPAAAAVVPAPVRAAGTTE